MTDEELQSILRPPSPDVVARLVAGHREFLAYLGPRVSNPAHAEEILQAAFDTLVSRKMSREKRGGPPGGHEEAEAG